MNERGDALLETVLIAPVLLLLGLIATEFGVSALRRSQLSECIRSTINFELINASDGFQDGRAIELALKKKLKDLPSIDENRPLEVSVKLFELSNESEMRLPFLSTHAEVIPPIRPKEFEVRVRAYSKTLFGSLLSLPPLDDIVTHRLRG